MTSHPDRNQTTFSEPFATTLDQTAVNKLGSQKTKLGLSVQTRTSPGYTFTPVMKRPVNPQQHHPSLEEHTENTMSDKTPLSPNPNNQTQSNGGFAFSPVTESDTMPSDMLESKREKEESTTTEIKPTVSANPIERVIPVATPAAKAMVEKVPSQYRRLLIVLLLLLVLLLTFFWLKPKAPSSIEQLQQGSSLPIEFRPVDEEEARRAEAQAQALQAEQHANASTAPTDMATSSAAETTMSPIQNMTASSTQVSPTRPIQNHEPVSQPATSSSVIYQPETTAASAKPAAIAKVVTPNVEHSPAAKPVTTKVTPQPKAATNSSSQHAVVSTKTMTVPKGVSLMQVFRDHQLNIADVNAMSKTNKVVSQLKVGEKITVRLDKHNRVVEMSIGSGGTFIRQANGSYLYQ